MSAIACPSTGVTRSGASRSPAADSARASSAPSAWPQSRLGRLEREVSANRDVLAGGRRSVRVLRVSNTYALRWSISERKYQRCRGREERPDVVDRLSSSRSRNESVGSSVAELVTGPVDAAAVAQDQGLGDLLERDPQVHQHQRRVVVGPVGRIVAEQLRRTTVHQLEQRRRARVLIAVDRRGRAVTVHALRARPDEREPVRAGAAHDEALSPATWRGP